ncbi:hypothetical protein L3X38_045098 [Prunus dulcis]|uniref:Uncharacterized protein n=1 Tax=Prunus dulcis TaxID=3755 RepID=A0AAD4YMT5_PRUDU|nr:hypothetical protein L3X38_045098 [Prunus dulcis]
MLSSGQLKQNLMHCYITSGIPTDSKMLLVKYKFFLEFQPHLTSWISQAQLQRKFCHDGDKDSLLPTIQKKVSILFIPIGKLGTFWHNGF